MATPVVVALSLVGCGSTLQPGAFGPGDGLGGQTVTVGAGTAGGTDGLGGPAAGGQDRPGAAAPAGAGSNPVDVAAGRGGGGLGRTRVGAPVGSGSTKANGPIKLGIVTVNIAALAAVFGVQSNTDPADSPKKFVDYLNKNGGIGGRKVEATYVSVDVGADQNSESQRACEVLTVDTKVDVVWTNQFDTQTFLGCLRQRGVSAFDPVRWTPDQTGVAPFPNWLIPDAARVDRYTATEIEAAVADGVLKRGDKLGILVEDCPWGPRVVDNVVKPLAAKYGFTTDTSTFKCVTNLVNDLGPATTSARAAVLRFSTPPAATHVMTISAAEGFLVDQFTSQASQQHYFPKYVLSTNAFPYNNSGNGVVQFSKDALPNMAGFGFLPYLDVGEAGQQSTPEAAAVRVRCRQADPTMGGAASVNDGTQWQGYSEFYAACDAFFLLKQVIEASGLRLGINDLAAAYASVAPNIPSAETGVARLAVAGGRRDGIGSGRSFKWSGSAFVYTGGPRPIP